MLIDEAQRLVMSDATDPKWPEGFIAHQIRGVSRRLLLWNGIVVGLVPIVIWVLWFYLAWFFHGPELVDDAFILDAAKGPTRSLIAYVELRDRRLVPTGYVEESSQNGKVYSTTAYYFIAVDGQLMLVKALPNAQGQRLVGPLESITVKVDQHALAAIVAKNPQLRDRILPVMLNASAAFNVFGYVLFGIVTPILVLCSYNMARAVIRRGRTRMHPVWRMLARQGNPFELSRAIDDEMAEKSVLTVGKAFITRNWLLRPTLFGLIACRMDDIAWAFHAIISGDNVATLAFRDGRMIGIPLHRNTPELLARVYQRAPWVEKGWDRDKATKWRTQRARFLAEVDSRRRTSQ
jgi:hypothetical protein